MPCLGFRNAIPSAMRLFLTLCSLAALALLAACGTKGLLYLPPAQQAAVPLVRPAGSTLECRLS